MNQLLFSPRRVFRQLAAATVLWLVALACAGSAPDSAAEPPQSTVPAIEESPAGEAPVEGTPQFPVLNPTAVPQVVQPALPERRFLKLEFPSRIRSGDSDIVRLTLEVDDRGNIVPTAEVEGNVVTGDVIEIPNLYETHYVAAEARFDIAGMEVRPAEVISAPLSPGSTALFFWSVRPDDVGVYRGTIWLYLRFVDKVSGEESQKTVSVQTVEIESVNFLGLSANLARSTGIVGSIVGTVLGFPFFEDILRFVFRRRQKQ